ncbi:MAG: DUF5671 domain-containing protein [Chloroflexota bacterium]|nr:DUF5671 domain-containing protein [Chloroflexota bacterium]
MSIVRRWYVYLVSAISLQTVTWAIIALLRNLLISRLNPQPTAIAFQISVILVGLPIFLAHWLWGQRLVKQSFEELGATLRRFYLYGTLAAFLGPFTANVYDLIGALLRAESTLDTRLYRPYSLTYGGAILYHLLALLVLGVLWFYHQQVVAEDAKTIPEVGGSATMRRLYVLGFNVAGLTMTALAAIKLLRWILLQLGGSVVSSSAFDVGLTTELARLITGLPVWLIFWRWAQRLFAGPGAGVGGNKDERESALRKLYLYGAVFIGAMSVVVNGTGILASVFRRVLGLPPEGDIRVPLPIIIVMGTLWAYHALVIRDDAAKAGEAPRQAGVRRLYLYLIAAVGLSAVLVGLSGDVSVMIRALAGDMGFGTELEEQLAWFTAAIIAGLPVWILPWWQAQDRATEPGPAGTDARRSTVRKIYVYFFMLVATMTVLSGAVFIIFRISSWLLGLDIPTLNELGHAIAYSMIAVCVWLYHGSILRSDHRLSEEEQVRRLKALRVAVVDVDDGQFGLAVVDALKRQVPELGVQSIILAHSGGDEESMARLAQAGLIVVPWTITIPGGEGDVVSPLVFQAVASSPARKLLVPTRFQDWEWAGVNRWDTELLIRQTVHAVKQIAAGEEVKPARPLGAGAVIAIAAGVLCLLFLLVSPLLSYFSDNIF